MSGGPSALRSLVAVLYRVMSLVNTRLPGFSSFTFPRGSARSHSLVMVLSLSYCLYMTWSTMFIVEEIIAGRTEAGHFFSQKTCGNSVLLSCQVYSYGIYLYTERPNKLFQTRRKLEFQQLYPVDNFTRPVQLNSILHVQCRFNFRVFVFYPSTGNAGNIVW